MGITMNFYISCWFLYIKNKNILSLMIGSPQIFRKVRNYVSYILIFVASKWLQAEKMNQNFY